MSDPGANRLSETGATSLTVLECSTTTTTTTTMETTEGGGEHLKRRGSWKRFKESVKETVQGWVGGAGQPQEPPEAGVPSAVFPSSEVNAATINVNQVLHATNCYSGGGGISSNMGSATPRSRGGSCNWADPGQLDIPMIVVTSEEKKKSPERPPRRSSAVPIRPSVSTPDVSKEEENPVSFSFPARAPSPDNDPEAEMKKRMAVMKIKQAIMTMNDAPTSSASASSSGAIQIPGAADLRRHSDTPQVEAAAVATPGGRVGKRNSSPIRVAAQGSLTPQQRALLQQRRKSNTETSTATTTTTTAATTTGGSPSGATVARSSSMKKAKAKPMIWDHFDTLPNTNLQGRCKVCRMNVSCKFNTGNFVRHLQLAHKDIYRQYQSKMENQWTRSMLERNLK